MLHTVLVLAVVSFAPPEPTRAPLHRSIDLDVGDQAAVEVPGGPQVEVRVLDLKETRDPFRDAVREARVTIEVDGKKVELVSGNYRLPVPAGRVQVDCPVTRGIYSNANENSWGLNRAVRLRFWPAGSPWVEPGTFKYPARQKWFASGTQMANEPVFVDGGEVPANKKIYYHSGLDIGGAEGMVDVVAATDGLVVSSGTDRLPGYEGTPVSPRYDVVYLLDDRGWYYRYSHMKTIEPGIRPGSTVKIGQKIGVLGKEGGSGGWSHLHFEIKSRQPSGQWGTQEGYAFLWQSYVEEFQPAVIAVARPHHLAAVGETVTLDGSRSWVRSGSVAEMTWLLGPSPGSPVSGATVQVRYDRPGTYSEILAVRNKEGQVAYDFAVTQVLDPKEPGALPPSIQAAFAPTQNIKPGDPVTFKVRTFRTQDGEETWDFGDGGAPVTVRSDGNREIHNPDGFAVTVHRFDKAGDYLVRVARSNRQGFTATAHLWVHVEPR